MRHCIPVSQHWLHCTLSLAAQCIVIGPVCLFATGRWAVSVTTITRNCVHRFSPNCVSRSGSDHLQLIKFWQSCAPGKGACGGGKFWLCLTTAIADSVRLWGTAAGAQCLHLSECFFIESVFISKLNSVNWHLKSLNIKLRDINWSTNPFSNG